MAQKRVRTPLYVSVVLVAAIVMVGPAPMISCKPEHQQEYTDPGFAPALGGSVS